MSSGTSIILDALKNIGAHSVANPASGETISDAYTALQSMLELWLSDGIDLGYTPTTLPGGEINEPRDTRLAIVYNLAIVMAPMFDNGKVVVSQTLQQRADEHYQKVKDLYEVVSIPRKVVSSTLPVGSGNRRGFDRNTFFDQGAEIQN